MGTDLGQRLRVLGACDAAVEWVGGRTPEQAWAECPRGDWRLWALETSGVDCSAVGYWCAERARQSALRALPPSPARDRLAACAPIIDRETARAAAMEARAVASAWAWAMAAAAEGHAIGAAAAAVVAARAVAWASAEALASLEEAEAAAGAAEERAIADYVREHYAMPELP